MTQSDTTFLKDIKNLPLLTAEQERELGTTIQQSKNKANRDAAVVELVEHNLRLAVNEAYKYARRSSVAVDELFSAGRAGLVRAAYDYDPIKFNTRFSTYATQWVRQGIREVIHGSSPVKIPSHIINGLYKKNRAIEENGVMTDDEIRDELDLTEDQLDKINKANISAVSLNATISGKDGIANETTIGDIIPDEEAKIPGVDGLDDPRYDFLVEAMSELDQMSQDIVRSQVLEADKVKLSDLGARYGLTGERVRQIKDKALWALKKKIVCRMKMGGYKVDPEMIKEISEATDKKSKKRGRPKKKA